MTSHHIYLSLLEEKTSTENKYSKIYLNLIDKALLRNDNHIEGEFHHIYPRCFCDDDKTLICDQSNIVKLTYREHFIAHRLLSKFNFKNNQDKRSMEFAVSCFMRNHEARKLSSREFSIAKEAVRKAMKDLPKKKETRNKLSEKRKGKSVFYDKEGNIYYLNTDDSLIKELELFGNRKNTVIAKDIMGNIVHTNADDERLASGELVGIMKGKTTYRSKDGKNYTLDVNDPLIEKLNLVHVNIGRRFKMPKGSNSKEKNPMYGRTKEVCCFDLKDKVFLRIDKKVFDSDERYVGVNNKIAKQYRKTST